MPNDDKLSLEEAIDQQRSLDEGNVVSFNGAPPGYEGTTRSDIEDFLDHGTSNADIPKSDEPLAFYDDVKFMTKHFNQIFLMSIKNDCNIVIWEQASGKRQSFSQEEFNKRFRYSKVKVKEKKDLFVTSKEWQSSTKVWLENSEARSFRGNKFYPGDGDDPMDLNNEYYNDWNGWVIKPVKDTIRVKRILRHVYAINCLKNKERANHFLNFFAHMFQKPTEKPSFSLMILAEEEGGGKSMIINAICEIIGLNHAFPVSNLEHVFGNHNEILDNCIFLSFEESDIKSNIRYTRELRDLITNHYLLVNLKHKHFLRQRNFTRCVFIGNAEILAYVSRTDRRHTVLRSAPDKIGDVEYFEDLKNSLDRNGLEALLYYFLHKDISEFNPFKPLWTEELDEQKELSVDKSLYSVWLEWLTNGSLPFEELGSIGSVELKKGQEPRWITVQEKLLYCINRLIKRDGGKELSMKSFGRKFRKIVPEMTKSQNMKCTPEGVLIQMYAYDIPSLKDCRAHFANHMRWKHKIWDNSDANWEVMIVDKSIWFKGW
jgi:Family of unknown function (DUF5906)